MAPKGNKYAVGHGRPPNPGFSDEEIVKLGEELLQWCKDNEENEKIVHLSQFYLKVKDIGPTQWDNLSERACFHGYYEKAINWMAAKVMTNKRLSESYGNRYISMYDKKLHKHEKEKVEHKIDYQIEKENKSRMQSLPQNDAKFDSLLGNLVDRVEMKKVKDENAALKEEIERMKKANGS